MTALAVTAAMAAFASYVIRRTASPEDMQRRRLSTGLSALALVLVAVYLYLKVTGSA